MTVEHFAERGASERVRSPAESRAQVLEELTAEVMDLLVVGGGIVGAGVARDAALRGLRVGLIDRHDFAYGTSSRSSRLLHGGIRYLAQGRIGLVREASHEKKILHQIAPHLAEPLPFIFPTYRDNREWVLWQLKLGVKLYDLLCGGGNFQPSTWLSRAETTAKVPGLSPDGLQGAVRYFDGFTNDARLVLDTLRSAARAGARLANYCQFQDARREQLWHCSLVDEVNRTPLQVRARAVVNATGPWAESVPHSRVKLRLTKGVHLIVDRRRLAVSETVVMTQGKRILFAIPWGERTVLGTTDTDFAEVPESVRPLVDDVAEVLAVVDRFFPGAHLTPADVLSAWAGLRPLIADPQGKPSDISRSHEIREAEPGWWDVAGGKLTTYRLMGEQTVDRVIRFLGRTGSCRTADEPLLPPAETEGVSGILPPRFSRQIVEHSCREEWALRLEDVMVRRTGWCYYHAAEARQMAVEAAEWMAAIMNWPPEKRHAELSAYGAFGDTALTSVVPGRVPAGQAIAD